MCWSQPALIFDLFVAVHIDEHFLLHVQLRSLDVRLIDNHLFTGLFRQSFCTCPIYLSLVLLFLLMCLLYIYIHIKYVYIYACVWTMSTCVCCAMTTPIDAVVPNALLFIVFLSFERMTSKLKFSSLFSLFPASTLRGTVWNTYFQISLFPLDDRSARELCFGCFTKASGGGSLSSNITGQSKKRGLNFR